MSFRAPRRGLSSALVFFGFAACGGGTTPATAPPSGAAPTGATSAPDAGVQAVAAVPPAEAYGGLDPSAMDRSVSPCKDFYRYACGGWLKTARLRDDESRRVRSFNGIHDRNEVILRNLLEAYARGENAADPYAKPLGDFYASCMDQGGIDALGMAPAAPYLALAASVKDARSFAKAAGDLAPFGVAAPVVLGVEPDPKNADRMMLALGQGGLGLPNRDMYLAEDKPGKDLLVAYEQHVARMLALSGEPEADAKAHAKAIVALETRLARGSLRFVEMRDPHALYHPHPRMKLKALAPGFDWDAYLSAAGIPKIDVVNVLSEGFVKAVGEATKATPPSDLAEYLKWHTLQRFAPYLPKAFADEAFRMRSTLTGSPTRSERYRECLKTIVEDMPQAIGQGFVKATLGAEGKDAAKELLASVERAMEQNITKLTWMDDPTRRRALGKLHAITNMIAYPDVWRKYDGLLVERKTFLANEARATQFEHERQLGKLFKPVDRKDWYVAPSVVDAYYSAERNQMVFPAGILQAPFFDPKNSDAANAGAIGAVMGHEITHGFDDQGRQYDEKGNLVDWWTKPVATEFDRRASCLVQQYSSYVAVGDVHVDGKLTLGENIADLGGLKIAWAAFMQKLAASSMPRLEDPNALSPEQQFFIAFGQSWCTLTREPFARMLAGIDPHSPPELRVNGVVVNVPEFATTFQCKSGDPMVRASRCEIW